MDCGCWADWKISTYSIAFVKSIQHHQCKELSQHVSAFLKWKSNPNLCCNYLQDSSNTFLFLFLHHRLFLQSFCIQHLDHFWKHCSQKASRRCGHSHDISCQAVDLKFDHQTFNYYIFVSCYVVEETIIK